MARGGETREDGEFTPVEEHVRVCTRVCVSIALLAMVRFLRRRGLLLAQARRRRRETSRIEACAVSKCEFRFELTNPGLADKRESRRLRSSSAIARILISLSSWLRLLRRQPCTSVLAKTDPRRRTRGN